MTLGSPNSHVEFVGTFTGVPFVDSGEYLYDVEGPLNAPSFSGNWSMISDGGGSIAGTHKQNGQGTFSGGVFEANYVGVHTVTGGTAPFASVQGKMVAFGHRTTVGAEPQPGCFLTFQVQGLLLSVLRSRAVDL